MDQVIVFLIYFVGVFNRLLSFMIFIRVVLSWVPTKSNKVTEFVIYATEPIMRPFRRWIPNIGPIDISPIVAFLAIDFLASIILAILYSL